MEFVPAKWFHEGRLKPVRLIVIHCTVSPEMGTGAEAVANYFKAGTRRASTHRVSDNNSTVQCVKDENTAFGAAGANSDGLHLELVGYPDQTSQQWLDPFGKAMLAQAGSTIREWVREFHIPQRWLSVSGVADGKSGGFCTHWDVSQAFPDVSTGHWDPGPHFPKAAAFAAWFPEETDLTPEESKKLSAVDLRTQKLVTDTDAQQKDLDAINLRLIALEQRTQAILDAVT